MIVAAALSYKGQLIFTQPAPARHSHILKAVASAGVDVFSADMHQGFLTSAGHFVSRREARKIVEETGQPRNPMGFSHPDELYSEDVW